MPVKPVDQATFTEQWQQWHDAHEKNLAAPAGFLAITSLNWLGPEPAHFSDAPGSWTATTDGVTVDLADGEHLAIDGRTVSGRYEFGVIAERASVFAGFDDAVAEIAKRGGHDILRPRHPGNALRMNFSGVPAYDPDPRWVRPARFVPFETPRDVTVGAAVEGLQHVYTSPGRLDFELDGRALSLTAFNGRQPGSLSVLFTDATSGITTYAANRSIQVAPPDADGWAEIDFNRAVNLPCAYTDLATCPLPPAENRLPVAIEAGEKIPFERH
ncbi:MAG TPA: DUF1684 domain-containing protein [Streptosporangiaceae bacterium]|nr:DUF1684 domain-containing protein [Streptosporangiaceae bacterium]